MEAIIILRRCRNAANDIRKLERRIQLRRDAMLSVTPRLDPNGGSRGGGDPDLIGRILADIDDLERSMDARRKAEAVEICAVCIMLDRLTAMESQVLYGYYVRRESSGEIAKRLNYTAGYIRKIKADGERQLRGIAGAAVDALLPEWYREKEVK
ncbi:MAG: hypothetical protein IKE25_14050 [Clostridia bacterium]|nr:hypothetical protein [Clostridia bacterium]